MAPCPVCRRALFSCADIENRQHSRCAHCDYVHCQFPWPKDPEAQRLWIDRAMTADACDRFRRLIRSEPSVDRADRDIAERAQARNLVRWIVHEYPVRDQEPNAEKAELMVERTLTMEQLLFRILHSIDIPSYTLVCALTLFHRFSIAPENYDSAAEQRAFLVAALRVAQRVVEDRPYGWFTMTSCTQMPKKALGRYKDILLKHCNYDVHISADDACATVERYLQLRPHLPPWHYFLSK